MYRPCKQHIAVNTTNTHPIVPLHISSSTLSWLPPLDSASFKITSDVFFAITMLHNCISPTNRIQKRVHSLSTCKIHCYFQRDGFNGKTYSGHVNGLQTSIEIMHFVTFHREKNLLYHFENRMTQLNMNIPKYSHLMPAL